MKEKNLMRIIISNDNIEQVSKIALTYIKFVFIYVLLMKKKIKQILKNIRGLKILLRLKKSKTKSE